MNREDVRKIIYAELVKETEIASYANFLVNMYLRLAKTSYYNLKCILTYKFKDYREKYLQRALKERYLGTIKIKKLVVIYAKAKLLNIFNPNACTVRKDKITSNMLICSYVILKYYGKDGYRRYKQSNLFTDGNKALYVQVEEKPITGDLVEVLADVCFRGKVELIYATKFAPIPVKYITRLKEIDIKVNVVDYSDVICELFPIK